VPGLLAEAGYRTGLFGKSHFVPRPCEANHIAGRWKQGDPLPAPGLEADTDFWSAFDDPYLGFEVHHGAGGHNADRAPDMHYRAWLKEKGVDLATVDALHRPLYEAKPGEWPLPPELHQTTWIVDESLKFINAAGEDPWFCWTSIQDPHSPFVCPDPWYSQVEPEAQAPDLEEHPGKPAYYDSLVKEGIFEHGAHNFYEENGLGVPHTLGGRKIQGEDAIRARRAYKAMCNMIDEGVGRLVEHLKKTGQYDNTLIVFTSDHGDFLGDHGLWYKGLPAFDASQRVPLVVKAPGQELTGACNDLVSLIDLPTTFLEAAGVQPPPTFQGLSQLEAFAGRREAVREHLLVECNATARANQFTLVTAEWKLVVYQSISDGELYNRIDDPHQRSNLWDDVSVTSVKAELLHRLSRELLYRDSHQYPRIAPA